MSKLSDLKEFLESIDPETYKGAYLSNKDIEWLLQQALDKEYYEMLFHTYYERSKHYFNKIQNFYDEMTVQIKKDDKIKEKIICPKCKTDEHISNETYIDEDQRYHDIAYCDKCELIVHEEEHK